MKPWVESSDGNKSFWPRTLFPDVITHGRKCIENQGRKDEHVEKHVKRIEEKIDTTNFLSLSPRFKVLQAPHEQ
jgi:hypothetical protein